MTSYHKNHQKGFWLYNAKRTWLLCSERAERRQLPNFFSTQYNERTGSSDLKAKTIDNFVSKEEDKDHKDHLLKAFIAIAIYYINCNFMIWKDLESDCLNSSPEFPEFAIFGGLFARVHSSVLVD